MVTKAFIAAIMMTVAAPVFADDLPQGEYVGEGDGTKMTMSVKGNHVSLAVSTSIGGGCVGGGEGQITEAGKNKWLFVLDSDFADVCLIDVERDKKHGYVLTTRTGTDCSSYGGFNCFLDGTVNPK